MPQKTNIEWTDYSSNPIYAVNKETGKRGWFCVKVSPGCGHCYAESINVGRRGNKLRYTENNVDKVEFVLNEKELLEIIKLNARLAKKGETAKMFLMDMSDLFLEAIPDEFIDKIFAVAALCQNITFQILTKRAERMRDYILVNQFDFELIPDKIRDLEFKANRFLGRPDGLPTPATLKNVWLGVSCERQKEADERIPYLLETSAAIRFLSCEPLLGSIDLNDLTRKAGLGEHNFSCLDCDVDVEDDGDFNGACINWVIVGGESGSGARPCNIEWIRSIVRQCDSAGVPVFVKQLGRLPIQKPENQEQQKYADFLDARDRNDAPKGFLALGLSTNNKKGGDIQEFPLDLRVRAIPQVKR